MHWMKYSLLAVVATVAVGACDDATGGGDTGQARIFMSTTNLAGGAAEVAANATGAMGSLRVSQIDSMFVRITGVSALRSNADTADAAGGWVTIQLADSGGKRINLLRLPAMGGDSISLARGELAPGTYKNIRLTFDSASASVVLKENVTVGNHEFLKATLYPLRVPSGVIKIPTAGFVISEGSASGITLVFDAGTSVDRITATGSGKLQMSPVIHRR